MARSGDSYKRYVPDLDLSIEKNTTNVPRDGKYYLVCNGQIEKAFVTLKKAEEEFRKALDKLGYKPKTLEKQVKSPAEQNIEGYLDAKDLYWAESYKYRGRGGKGGRGGV